MTASIPSVTHLKQLEAESIQIFREVAAEFENPVMLYSVGKDSSVLLHLARKAFAPGKIPFPLLHVDTTWKFGEMIKFRDEQANSATNKQKSTALTCLFTLTKKVLSKVLAPLLMVRLNTLTS